jgi:hypothetical protein
MACRQTEYARKLREELLAQLGRRCVLCGENNADLLEFDHVNGRDYHPRELSYSHRMIRYRHEAAQGELRVLCGPCNRLVRNTNENGSFAPTASAVEKTVEIPF